MANKRQFTLTEEQDTLLLSLYQDNRRLFYSLSCKYAHNTEERHDLIQDALIYIATALQADYTKRTQDYRSLIYFAFKSIYKDRNVNAKNLEINLGEITDDLYDEAGVRRPDTYASPVVDVNGEMDDDVKLQMLTDSIAEDDIDRAIIELSIDGWTYREIGSKLGKSRQYIDYRLQKLRKRASFLKKSTFLRTHADK